MKESRRIKITHIHKEDAFYGSRLRLLGATGEFTPWGTVGRSSEPGYVSGHFVADSKTLLEGNQIFFYAIRYKRIT